MTAEGHGQRPPAFLRRALVRCLPDDGWSAEYVGALDDEYGRIARASGRWRAAAWYAGQMLSRRTVQFTWLVWRRRAARGGEGRMGAKTEALGRWTQDLGHAVRGAVRESRVTVFVALSLALGIGGTATMYGVADRLFLRGPEHVRDPATLARVYLRIEDATGGEGRTTPWIPHATALALEGGLTTAEGLATYRTVSMLGEVGDRVRPLRVSSVGDGYFEVLGAEPAVGRALGAGPSQEGRVAVVSGALAEALAEGGRAVGRSFALEDGRYTVVGVAPPGFTGPHLGRIDVWIPRDPATAGTTNWQIVARLPSSVAASGAVERFTAEANAVHARTDPGRSFQWARDGRFVAAPLAYDDAAVEPAEARVARLLVGVVLLVLVIACVNVVNLLLARVTRRRQEVAVRLALGAGPWRLLRLLLSESVVLAVLGGLVSLPLVYGGGTLLRRVLLPQVEWVASPLELRVIALVGAVALIIGLVVALLPAREAGRTDLHRALRAGEREGGGRVRMRLHGALATSQIALAAALLVGAGLFLKSFWTLRVTDLGFDPGATAIQLRSMDPEGLPHGSAGERRAYAAALERLRDEPGLAASAMAVGLPFVHTFGWSIAVPGLDSIPALPGGGPYMTAVTGGYFEAVGTRIVRGRPITDADAAGGERVVVVSESMASILWPGQDPLEKCVHPGSVGRPCSRVVGVAADVHRVGYREPPSMQFYVPLDQQGGFGGMALVVREVPGRGPAREALVDRLRTVDPAVDLVEATVLEEALEPQVRPWRLGAVVLAVAALLATAVSTLGVYGVLSYLVAQRRREMGVRIALGASRGAIRRLVLRKGAQATFVGIGMGLVLVLTSRAWLEPLLFETSVADPLVLGTVSGLLLTVAMLACSLPAGHAARVEPVSCLKVE